MSLRSSNNSPPQRRLDFRQVSMVGPGGEEIVVSDDESGEDAKRSNTGSQATAALDTLGISELVRSFLSLKDQSKMLRASKMSKSIDDIKQSFKQIKEQWYTQLPSIVLKS